MGSSSEHLHQNNPLQQPQSQLQQEKDSPQQHNGNNNNNNNNDDKRQTYNLCWNEFPSNLLSFFKELREQEDFVDVTLACEGQQLSAHKVVLSACSPYFRSLLKIKTLAETVHIIPSLDAVYVIFIMDQKYMPSPKSVMKILFDSTFTH
ncbi:hypothetical protein SK128_014781 [Halocaridina rubra]|uniref:BTB domain-containing protein n=1 Tax=Halocaridina rubra TaxID=373956 RepID=A0AAN9AB66_HALRR